jgi:hypothetical protein
MGKMAQRRTGRQYVVHEQVAGEDPDGHLLRSWTTHDIGDHALHANVVSPDDTLPVGHSNVLDWRSSARSAHHACKRALSRDAKRESTRYEAST